MPKMPPGRKPQLGDGLYRALTGLSPRSEGSTYQERVKDLIRRSGWSQRKAAEKMDVSTETLRRWKKGIQEPTPEHMRRLQQVQREARIKPRRAKKFLAGATGPGDGSKGPAGMRMKARVVVSQDERVRWLDLGAYVPPHEFQRVLEEMINGGPDAAGSMLAELANRYYFYQPATITEVYDIRW